MWGAIAGGAGALFGLATRKSDDKRQVRQQEKLNKLQEESNRRLMNESYGLQKDMYDHTFEKNTPEQQMARLKEAGLNPALMYGLGGQGGATAGGGGASISGASAADAAATSNAGTNKAQTALQYGMMQSQIELQKAQAKNIDADTEKKKGVDTELAKGGLQKLIAETSNTEAKTALTAIETSLKEIEKSESIQSREDRMGAIKYHAEHAAEQVQQAKRENKIGDETASAAIDQINAEAIGATLANELSRVQRMGVITGIQMDKTKMNEIGQNIEMGWRELGLKEIDRQRMWKELDNSTQNALTNKFKAEIEAQYPTTSKVTGRVMDGILGTLWNVGQSIREAGGVERVPYKSGGN